MNQGTKASRAHENAEVLLIDSRGVPYTVKEKRDHCHSVQEKTNKGGDIRNNTATNKMNDKDYNSYYSKKGKQFKCTVCGKSFKWPSHLRHHMRTHTSERPHKCSICQKGFKDAHKLNRHQQIHPEFKKDTVYWKLYKCDICDKNFKYQSDLDKHNLIHSGEKPFKCPICGVGFRRLDHLKRHNFVHTGDRPFKCSVCGKGFVEATEVLKHERIHTGDKPYQCHLCDKSFYHPRSLKEHTVTKHAMDGLEKTLLSSDEEKNYAIGQSTTTKNRTECVNFEHLPTVSRPHEIVICLSDDESDKGTHSQVKTNSWKTY